MTEPRDTAPGAMRMARTTADLVADLPAIARHAMRMSRTTLELPTSAAAEPREGDAASARRAPR